MDISFTPDPIISKVIRQIAENGMSLEFSDPIIVKKNPHSYPIKITSLKLNKDDLVVSFEREGLKTIDLELIEKIEYSVTQRLLLLKLNTNDKK